MAVGSQWHHGPSCQQHLCSWERWFWLKSVRLLRPSANNLDSTRVQVDRQVVGLCPSPKGRLLRLGTEYVSEASICPQGFKALLGEEGGRRQGFIVCTGLPLIKLRTLLPQPSEIIGSHYLVPCFSSHPLLLFSSLLFFSLLK